MNKTGLKLINDDFEQETFSPAVLNKQPEISLFRAIFYSTFLHIVGGALLVSIIAIVMFLIQVLGINLDLFKKPELQPKDIEFVLVNKEAKPINPNTKYRADRNSRAGGIHDPKKKVSMPTTPSKQATPQQKKAQQTQKKMEKLLPKRPMLQPPAQSKPAAKPQTQKQRVKQAHEAPKIPPRQMPPNAFNIPTQKHEMPKVTTGAAGGTQGGARSTNRTGSGGAPTTGSGRYNSPYSAGSGSLGNPSPGNPKGAPGIDAIAEPDFGPYMRDLQAKIKRNWDPPKSNNSKRTVLIFTIAKDGRLLNTRIYKSSGVPSIDKAALAAVEYSAPFRPLPKEFRGSDIDIHFTFDYNVFGGSVR